MWSSQKLKQTLTKTKSELEMMFAQEKMRLESELREIIHDLEAQLKDERERR